MKTGFLLLLVLFSSFLWIEEVSPALAESPYKLPIAAGQPIYVTQGNNGTNHQRHEYYAFDFATTSPRSFTIVAVRGGVVISIRTDSTIACDGENVKRGGEQYPGCWAEANYILIKHEDGSGALYMHLKNQIPLVKEGQMVVQGQPIGIAGDTGRTTQIHLHLQVSKVAACSQGKQEDIDKCKKQKGWWYNQSPSSEISFSDTDVLKRNPKGIPYEDRYNPYISDNTETNTPQFSKIDLQPIANWPFDYFTNPPSGEQSYVGIPFTILSGPKSLFQTRHYLILGNPIEGKLEVNIIKPKALYILLNGGYVDAALKGKEVGEIVLSFSDGTSLTTPIIAWATIREPWSYESDQSANSMLPSGKSITWQNVLKEKQFRGGRPALGYIDMVNIPIPDKYISQTLTSITIRDTSLEKAQSENPSLIVTAITAESQK